MSLATTVIGKTGILTRKIGLGAMSFTFAPNVSDEQAFGALKYALGQAREGEKVIINSSEHYGRGSDTHNLKLLSRFFTTYTDLQEKAFVVVKGAMGIFPTSSGSPGERGCSPLQLRASAEGIAKALAPKRVDVFEPGRVDKSIPIEEVMKSLVSLQKEGHFDYVGLSECSAETIKRASTITPITTVEIEVSPMSWEEETKKVIKVCEEVDATILAYSPIGRGSLAGTSWEEIPSILKNMKFPRFQEEAYKNNQILTRQLADIAKDKKITTAQLCIAWVASQGNHVVPIPGSSKVARVEENFASGQVNLTEAEKTQITSLAETADIQGNRFPGATNDLNWG